jgi:hypothetical protein
VPYCRLFLFAKRSLVLVTMGEKKKDKKKTDDKPKKSKKSKDDDEGAIAKKRAKKEKMEKGKSKSKSDDQRIAKKEKKKKSDRESRHRRSDKKPKKDKEKKRKKKEKDKGKDSSDRKKKSRKSEGKVETICCICKDKDADASAGGLCNHVFCLPCLEGMLHKPLKNPQVNDNHLGAPTLGRCPECRAELRKFEMKDTKKGKKKYKRSKGLDGAGINGKIYRPEDKSLKLAHFCFEEKKPHMSFREAIEADKNNWVQNDGSLVGEKKYFDKGYHWDETTRTFHGTISWKPVTFHGAYQWDIVLAFNKEFTDIHVGMIHERKDRGDKKSRVDEDDMARFQYPLDGNWKLLWKTPDGTPQTGGITVSNNEFQQGPYLFNINFSDSAVPKFRWPLDPVYATAKSGVNLKKKPLGPKVGERVVWETTHPAFREITWERDSIGEMPIQKTQHFGVSGNAYTAVAGKDKKSKEKDHKEEKRPKKKKSIGGDDDEGGKSKSKGKKADAEKSKSKGKGSDDEKSKSKSKMTEEEKPSSKSQVTKEAKEEKPASKSKVVEEVKEEKPESKSKIIEEEKTAEEDKPKAKAKASSDDNDDDSSTSSSSSGGSSSSSGSSGSSSSSSSSGSDGGWSDSSGGSSSEYKKKNDVTENDATPDGDKKDDTKKNDAKKDDDSSSGSSSSGSSSSGSSSSSSGS